MPKLIGILQFLEFQPCLSLPSVVLPNPYLNYIPMGFEAGHSYVTAVNQPTNSVCRFWLTIPPSFHDLGNEMSPHVILLSRIEASKRKYLYRRTKGRSIKLMCRHIHQRRFSGKFQPSFQSPVSPQFIPVRVNISRSYRQNKHMYYRACLSEAG